ncbi:hypothetical protein CRG98_009123 [Punica granatum]|uniref:Uncharacterized protein n=1 Tax=Punica granatum TaxID=22663 RepID=A0A2I0KPW9_PUNGR|nr:hypothetical protein CRG98_009123 [Punica granatum]
MSPVESPSCAHPNFNLVGARMREAYATRFGSFHLPGGVRRTRLYGPECGLSSGPALRAFGSRGLGVSTFPWGRVTDTRERRSRHLSFYDPKVEGG